MERSHAMAARILFEYISILDFSLSKLLLFIIVFFVTFLDQTIFGGGFPVARHSSLIEAPFDTSTLVDGAT